MLSAVSVSPSLCACISLCVPVGLEVVLDAPVIVLHFKCEARTARVAVEVVDAESFPCGTQSVSGKVLWLQNSKKKKKGMGRSGKKKIIHLYGRYHIDGSGRYPSSDRHRKTCTRGSNSVQKPGHTAGCDQRLIRGIAAGTVAEEGSGRWNNSKKAREQCGYCACAKNREREREKTFWQVLDTGCMVRHFIHSTSSVACLHSQLARN